MYIRDRQQMPETEEGAAFFRPMRDELDERMAAYPCPPGQEHFAGLGAKAPLSPRIMGVNRNQLTRGFTGFGAAIAPPVDTAIIPPPDKPGYAPADTTGLTWTTGSGGSAKYWLLGGLAVAGVWALTRKKRR